MRSPEAWAPAAAKLKTPEEFVVSSVRVLALDARQLERPGTGIGRVLAGWQGLAKKDRFEGRDLRISTDIRALLKGVLSDHLHVTQRSLNSEVFPGSEGVKGLSLLRV